MERRKSFCHITDSDSSGDDDARRHSSELRVLIWHVQASSVESGEPINPRLIGLRIEGQGSSICRSVERTLGTAALGSGQVSVSPPPPPFPALAMASTIVAGQAAGQLQSNCSTSPKTAHLSLYSPANRIARLAMEQLCCTWDSMV